MADDFKDGIPNDDQTLDNDFGMDDDLGDEDLIVQAIRELQNHDDVDDDDDGQNDDDDSDDNSDDDNNDDDNDDDNDDSDDDSDDQDDDKQNSDEQKGKKREQSKEENARFAAERRKREAEERAKAELERLKQESPEFQLAKTLSEQFGRPAEEILAEIKEQALQQQAKDQNIPIEILRQQQQDQERMLGMEQELNRLKFENWKTKIDADSERLKGEYKFLTDDDIQQSVDYILNTARNVDLPLEQAVFAVHGKKIVEELANAKLQEQLADQSGRKRKTPPVPNNGKPSKVANLTAEERYVARQFGMTDDEYLKYKQDQ